MRGSRTLPRCFYCCFLFFVTTFLRSCTLFPAKAFRSIPQKRISRLARGSVLRSAQSKSQLQLRQMSSLSASSDGSNVHNQLTISSIPKEWQDYDLKKDKVHGISNLEQFLHVLESTDESFTEKESKFDTIVETNDSNLEDTIVFFDLELTKPAPADPETIQIRLNREANEISRKAFQRLEISVAKKLTQGGKKKKKKNKKRKDSNDTSQKQLNEPSSRLLVCDGDLDDNEEKKHTEIDTQGVDAFGLCTELASLTESSFVELDVTMPLEPETNDENSQNQTSMQRSTNFRFGVNSNLPMILATQTFESFRSKLFVGIPIVIQTTLLHATGVEVSWFLGGGDDEAQEELVLRNSHSFVPEANHIGRSLSVVLRPVRGEGSNYKFGRPEAYKFHNKIEEVPSMPIVSPLREKFVQEKTTKDSKTPMVRVCTYNILADLYVSRKGTTDGETTYPHVLYEHVEKTRRIPMIVAELLAYQADIICLQEVDGSVYDAYLEPIMLASGYEGYYSNKASQQREGCAMFWSTNAFEADQRLAFPVKNLFEPTKNAEFELDWSVASKGVNELLKSNLELKRIATEKLGQVLQVAKLKMKNSRNEDANTVVVANTHLFWHPMADHVRAMQAFVVAKKIDEVRRGQNKFPDPFLLCGDLNSDPLSGASQLLTSKSINSDHHDCWNYLHTYQMDIDDNDVEVMVDSGTTAEERRSSHQNQQTETPSSDTPPPTISLPDSFPSLVSGCQPKPPFTNFTPKFVETLDYVLASQLAADERAGFSHKRSAAMPTIKDVEEFVSMPNKFMPSDHVSIVCDLEWCKSDHLSRN